MDPTPVTKPVIRKAQSSEGLAALRLVMTSQAGGDPQDLAQLLIGQARAGQLDLDKLLVAMRGDMIVGATWGTVIPGRCASVWPPHLVDGEPSTTATQLLCFLEDLFLGAGVRVAQALLAALNHAGVRAMLDHGYRHLTDLAYLGCAASEFPMAPPNTGELVFSPYCERDHQRLLELIDVTYQQTRDCPDLDGMRDTADVLHGYQHVGVFDPNLWFLVQYGTEDVGCLLLADHPAQRQCELIYMGLIPAARGRGWGRVLTRYAQWAARQCQERRLVVAVDVANSPAHVTYLHSGFTAMDCRHLLVRSLANGPDEGP